MSSSPLNQVDIAFVVDTTGSMGPFIDAAQKQLLKVLRSFSSNQSLDLKVGIVEYRDFPPQDSSFVTRVYDLTADFEQVQKTLRRLHPSGGGDVPEAVYSGLSDACSKLEWRPHSSRFLLLVGDAPPHAFRPWDAEPGYRNLSGDGFARACPSGLDVLSVTAEIEEVGATLHALCMVYAGPAHSAFTELATMTGGRAVAASRADAVIREIEAILRAEFEHIELDSQVLAEVREQPNLEIREIAQRLDVSRLSVAASLGRLGKRRLLGG